MSSKIMTYDNYELKQENEKSIKAKCSEILNVI